MTTSTMPLPGTTDTSPDEQLSSLVLAVLDCYHASGLLIPQAMLHMLPCVHEALQSEEEAYINVTLSHLRVIVEDCGLCEEARVREAMQV